MSSVRDRDVLGQVALFTGGLLCLCVGATAIVYGIAFIWYAAPNNPTAMAVLSPLTGLLKTLVTTLPLAIGVGAGAGLFVWELRRNGIQFRDPRLRYEIVRDMRREKAKESDVWEPPEAEREGEDVYEELRKETQTGGVEVVDSGGQWRNGIYVAQGVVRNRSDEPARNIKIKVLFVDVDGETVDTGLASRHTLEPDETWKFEVFGRHQNVESYRMSDPLGSES